MAAAERLTDLPRATDSNSSPLSGATWTFYATGTTTPQAVYTTAALTVAHANPVVADSSGLFAPIYFDASLQYRGILKTAAGATIQDIDPVNTGLISQLADALNKLPRSPQYDDDAHADGTTADDTAVAASLAAKKVVQLDATHLITTTKDLAYDQSLLGFGRQGTLKVNSAAGLTLKTMLRCNADATNTTWVNDYSNLPGSRIEDITFDAVTAWAAGGKVTAVVFGGSLQVRNVHLSSVVAGFKAVSTYNDMVVFESVYFGSMAEQTTEYGIELGLGDGVRLATVEFPEGVPTDADHLTLKVPRAIKVFYSAGLNITGQVNGITYLTRVRGFTIQNCHWENGGPSMDDSIGTVRDCIAWRRADGSYLEADGNTYTTSDFDMAPYQVGTTDNFSNVGDVTLERCQTAYEDNFKAGWPVGGYDLTVKGTGATRIEDCSRLVSFKKGAIDTGVLLGWTAGQWDNATPSVLTALDSFNAYSHFASRSSRIQNRKLRLSASVGLMTAGVGLGGLSGSNATRTWAAGAGDYTFKSQILYDKFRQAGYTGSAAIAIAGRTVGGNGVRLALIGPDFPHINRLYFGTGADPYRYYLEIPLLTAAQSGSLVFFNGVDLNGFAVTDRGAGNGAAVIPINEHLVGGFDLTPGDNGNAAYGIATMRTTSTTALIPATGSFRAGDRVIGPNATAEYDGAAWNIIAGKTSASANMNNADVDVSATRFARYLYGETTIMTADHALKLPLATDVPGARVTVARAAASTGAFKRNVWDGTTTFAQLDPGQTYELTSLGGSWAAVRTT